MASVRKRVLPSDEKRWQVDYRDVHGIRRHKQFKTKAEADSYETDARAGVKTGTHVADSASVSVREAGDLWLARAAREGLEAGTVRQYRQHLKYAIVPMLGKLQLSKLSTLDIETFRDDLLKTRSRALSRAILTSMRGVIKEAKRLKLIGHDPAAETSVKISKRDKPRVEIPSKDEIRALVSKTAELWPLTRQERSRKGEIKTVAVPWRPLFVTAIFSGLRSSELRGLAWSNIDLKSATIHVTQRADFQNTIGSPKSEAGTREVPMSPMVLNTLRQWKLVCPATRQGLVFPTENGTVHSNSNIYRVAWAPLQHAAGTVREAGVDKDGVALFEPKLTFHALRHAAASLFIEQGWSPKKVQTVMGHSSIQVTFDTYGHLWKTPVEDLEAMAQIEARLLG